MTRTEIDDRHVPGGFVRPHRDLAGRIGTPVGQRRRHLERARPVVGCDMKHGLRTLPSAGSATVDTCPT